MNKRVRPDVERLEGRELPSAPPLPVAAPLPLHEWVHVAPGHHGRPVKHHPKHHAKHHGHKPPPTPASLSGPVVPTPLLGQRWPGTHPDLLAYLDGSLASDEVLAVEQAAQIADQAAGGHVRVDFTGDRSAAQIIYEDNSSLDPSIAGTTLYNVDPTLTYFVGQTVVELNGTAIRDDATAFLGVSSPVALLHVAVHETGHAVLGLGHSPDPADVMFATINPTTAYSLADVVAVTGLYP